MDPRDASASKKREPGFGRMAQKPHTLIGFKAVWGCVPILMEKEQKIAEERPIMGVQMENGLMTNAPK